MSELRDLCRDLGWRDVRTYIQSGNLVFSTAATSGDELENDLSSRVEKQFGFGIVAVVREYDSWVDLLESNPFREEAENAPNRVMTFVPRSPIVSASDQDLSPIRLAAKLGERIAVAGGALWVHYPEGQGKSRLTSAVLERPFGPMTARNWRTMSRLRDIARTGA